VPWASLPPDAPQLTVKLLTRSSVFICRIFQLNSETELLLNTAENHRYTERKYFHDWEKPRNTSANNLTSQWGPATLTESRLTHWIHLLSRTNHKNVFYKTMV
jgi:hypothetical protein